LPLRFPSEDAQHRRASSPTTTQPSPTIARARSLCQATATTGMLISEKCQSAQDYYRADPENQQRQNDECVRPTQFRIGPGNDRTGSSDQLGPHEVLTHIVQLNPEEMEGRLTRVYEPNLTTTVANIEHIESTTVNGEAIVKIFPATERQPGDGERPGYGNFADHLAPAAARNPATALIISYSASSVPILLGLMPGTFGAAAGNANNPPGSSPRNRVLYGLRLI